MKYLFFLMLLCLCCTGQKDEGPDLRSVYLKDDSHHKFIVDSDVPFYSIFALQINERPDEFHKLNPDLIIKTDLKKVKGNSFLRSMQSGIVYHCVFEIGDTVVVPKPGRAY